jgi:hypothetical protein
MKSAQNHSPEGRHHGPRTAFLKPASPLALAVLLLGLGWNASADIAPMPLLTGGNALAPKDQNATVEMASEEVDLYPSKEANRVVARFSMKNPGAEDVTLKVGFPSYFELNLQDFQVEINGQKQAASAEKETLTAGRKQLFKYWMCWDMTFPKGKETQIKVSYAVKMSTMLPSYARAKTDLVGESLLFYNSGYVLRTGAGWAGNIGKAVIRLHYEAALKKQAVSNLNPKDGWQYDAAAHVDTLTLLDFKPTEKSDIAYTFKLFSDRDELAVLNKALEEKRLTDYMAQDRQMELLGRSQPERIPGALETYLDLIVEKGSVTTARAEFDAARYYKRLAGLCQQTDPARLARAARTYQKFLEGAVVAAKRDEAKLIQDAEAGKIAAGMDEANRKRIIEGNKQFHRNHIARLEKEQADVAKAIEAAPAAAAK